MKSNKTKIFTDSVVVYPEDLTYFDDFLRNSFNTIEYTAICEDGTEIRPNSLNELLEYENPDFKRIASITINALDGQSSGDSVEIIIGMAGLPTSGAGVVRFNFKDIKRQNPIEDEVVNRIKGMRPCYFYLNKISFKYFLPLSLLVFSLIMVAIGLLRKFKGTILTMPVSTSRFTEGEETVLALGVYGVFFLVGYFIDCSRDYFFPKYFFCIGRQKKAFERRRNIVRFIFGAIFIGIIINIVAAHIDVHIFR